MRKLIAFFHAEASLEIGTGHIMRCLVLANYLKKNGWDCKFVTSIDSYKLIPYLQNFSRINPLDIVKKPVKTDLSIFDNYNIDFEYEKFFRPYSKVILVIDDLSNRNHDCDIILDQNLGSNEKEYKGLVNSNCKILAGIDYALIRDEFLNIRKKALEKRKKTQIITKILVNFGGSDLKNYTLKALQGIENSQFNGNIEVVLGFKAPNLEEIKKFTKYSKNNIKIHELANMPQIIYESDIAIAAGGCSAWERCFLGLPTYIIKIAKNQEKIYKELGFLGSFNDFLNYITKNYQDFSLRIANYVDGAGVQRVYKEILQKIF